MNESRQRASLLPSAATQAHMRTCACCRELAWRLAKAVAAVALSVERVGPPEGLGARLRVGGSGSRADGG